MHQPLFAVLFIIIIIVIIVIIFSVSSKDNKKSCIPRKEYTFRLTGQQEVPAVNTNAYGKGTVVLNSPTNIFYNIQTKGFLAKPIAAHFHKGGIGVNGPIVLTLDLVYEGQIQNKYTYRGHWTSDNKVEPLTPELVEDLKNGLLYVNVHTNAYPNGEIRGQIVK